MQTATETQTATQTQTARGLSEKPRAPGADSQGVSGATHLLGAELQRLDLV
jgi:hypothetical protein